MTDYYKALDWYKESRFAFGIHRNDESIAEIEAEFKEYYGSYFDENGAQIRELK